jgi:FixJ family two-component response regulator
MKSAAPHVLICDDDRQFSAEFVEALTARGFAATAFLSMSALRTALLTPTTLILDICMPEPDGIEILNMLARHEHKARFKIVLVSGWDERILGMAASLCHVHGLKLLGTFSKPVSVRALCDLLQADADEWD